MRFGELLGKRWPWFAIDAASDAKLSALAQNLAMHRVLLIDDDVELTTMLSQYLGTRASMSAPCTMAAPVLARQPPTSIPSWCWTS